MRSESELPIEELKERLDQIREINRRCRAGEITNEERIKLHQLLVPDIGDMEGSSKGKGNSYHFPNEEYEPTRYRLSR